MSWSALDLAFQCLADVPRTRAFLDALGQVVTPQSVVLDAGSGTGALAVAAAKAGAREVIAVEQDPFAARILASNVRAHSLPVKVLCGDLRDLSLPPCDVVIAELVDVWLLEEQLVEVLCSLRAKGVINQRTHVIPTAYDFDIELGHCNWEFPYFAMRSPFYEWPYLHDRNNGWIIPHFGPVTSVARMGTLALAEILSPSDRNLTFVMDISELSRSDRENINAVRLSGTLHLSHQIKLGISGSLNAPIVLPIEADLLHAQDSEINIRAMMSGGFQTLSMSLGAHELLPWRA